MTAGQHDVYVFGELEKVPDHAESSPEPGSQAQKLLSAPPQCIKDQYRHASNSPAAQTQSQGSGLGKRKQKRKPELTQETKH